MLLDQQFNTINEKLQQLLKQYSKLQKENERLTHALSQEIAKESELQNKIHELEQRVSVLKLAAGEMNEKEKKEFDRKLNQYIKEVDKVISMLGE